MKSEIWEPLVFAGDNPLNGDYLVSNLGRIQKKRTGEYVRGHPVKGYLCSSLYANGFKKTYAIHRLVAKAFVPNPENKPQVNHKNRNKEDNAVSNLEWVTGIENNRHAFKGKPRQRKLTTSDVKEILAWWKTGDVTKNALAAKWDVSGSTIWRICAGVSWKLAA